MAKSEEKLPKKLWQDWSKMSKRPLKCSWKCCNMIMTRTPMKSESMDSTDQRTNGSAWVKPKPCRLLVPWKSQLLNPNLITYMLKKWRTWKTKKTKAKCLPLLWKKELLTYLWCQEIPQSWSVKLKNQSQRESGLPIKQTSRSITFSKILYRPLK